MPEGPSRGEEGISIDFEGCLHPGMQASQRTIMGSWEGLVSVETPKFIFSTWPLKSVAVTGQKAV